MAVLFSVVTVTAIAKGEQLGFLVGGIPRELSDLEGWTAFDNFIGEIDEEMDISVHADGYIYGDGELYKATPEEVAYFYKRMEDNQDFLTSRCQNIDKADFDFNWSPDELYGMEMN